MSSKLWTEEQFNCPVCLDLPNDPVTLPCGHSYCMGCIKDYWSKDDPSGVYTCPQCRQTFCPKPPLSRNTMLAEAVEQLRKAGRRPSVRSSVPGKQLSSSAVPCDLCKGEHKAAVKSCLTCMSSYCDAHLKPHHTKKNLKEHELIPPTANMADKICTQHKYLQEFYCRVCKVYICWICTSNQHKGHECSSTKAERIERQKAVGEMQVENQQRLKEREQQLKNMKKMMEQMKRSAGSVHDEVGGALEELQRSVERLQELLEEVLDQAHLQKTSQAQEVVDNLEEEIKELRMRDTQMKDLNQCEDHIHYLETCDSMSSPLACADLPPVQVNMDASFQPVQDAVLDLRNRVEDLCNQELGNITKQVNDITLYTLGDASKGQSKGILKLFAALGSRGNNSTSRSAASVPSISIGGRRTGVGVRTPDVRSRETPRVTDRGNSPRLRVRQRTEDRDSVREGGLRPSPTPTRRGSPSMWSRASTQSHTPSIQSHAPSSQSHTPSSQSHAPSSQSHAPVSVPPPKPTPAPAPVTPTPVPAPSGFSRMASITSLFRSHRKGTNHASPAAPISMPSGTPWGMTAVPETPTEINPALFLDTPTSNAIHLEFPALRELSLDRIQAPEPRARDEFLQYSVMLTLDPSSAHKRLTLSEGNTKATLQGPALPQPDTPQRFDGWTQVLSSGPVPNQRSYWEVDWRGRGSSIGVAYGALPRKGSDARSGLGYNAQSWTLELSDTCCLAMHDNAKRDIPVAYSPRVGLYLDQSAGTLEFYSVAGNMTHLHTFRANFTQPVYAAFGVGSGVGVGLDFALGQFSTSSDSIKICSM